MCYDQSLTIRSSHASTEAAGHGEANVMMSSHPATGDRQKSSQDCTKDLEFLLGKLLIHGSRET